jgi:hypothetical protein
LRHFNFVDADAVGGALEALVARGRVELRVVAVAPPPSFETAFSADFVEGGGGLAKCFGPIGCKLWL